MAPSEDSDRDGGDVPRFASDDRDPRYRLLRPREWRTYTRYHFLLAKFLFFGAIAALLYWGLSAVSGVLFPIAVSLVLAYLFDPLVDWFEERTIPRTVGILVILVGVLAIGALFVLIFYPTMVEQVRHVVDRFPKLVELIQNRTIPWLERNLGYEVPKTVDEGVQKYGESVGDYLPDIFDQAGSWARGILLSTGAVLSGVIYAVMIPVFTFYFLRDFDRIRLKLIEFLPEHRRNYILARAREMDRVVGEWVRGQLQVATMLALLYSIGLIFPFLACGLSVRAAVTVGVLTGMLNFIPYFGVGVGMILSTLMIVINWSGLGPLVGMLGVFAGVQTLEGYLITPRIVGDKVGMSPVTVIIVLLAGGELYGLFGVLLAVPVFGAFKVLLPDIVDYYKETPFFTGRRLVPDSIESRQTKREKDRRVTDPEGQRAPADSELLEQTSDESPSVEPDGETDSRRRESGGEGPPGDGEESEESSGE